VKALSNSRPALIADRAFGRNLGVPRTTRRRPHDRPLSAAEQALRDAALEYHRTPTRGKISVTPTKPLSNQRDLSLAYSPGVAYACLAIEADPSLAAEYTSRGNLVGVVTNGTAVLGLGDIGPLAGKPVMEGKGCLFKKFAGIDVFDIELAERDPDKLVEIIAALEPTLGGVNLEDIKAPECFYIEKKLRERMNIPVFHDDQHGTAIISAAALLNGLELVGKRSATVKLAVSGAGAAAIACLDVMVAWACAREHLRRRQQGRDPRSATTPRQARREQAALLPAHRGAHAGRRGAGRRRVPGLLGRRRADAEMVLTMAAQAHHPGAGQPRARDPPRTGQGGAARLHHRHRPQRLPEPGQQRPVLPLHLPRRAGLRRHQDHRGDEAGLRARDRRAGQGRDQRRGGRRLRRAGPASSAPTTSSPSPSTRG
jgi:hypothetical protein